MLISILNSENLAERVDAKSKILECTTYDELKRIQFAINREIKSKIDMYEFIKYDSRLSENDRRSMIKALELDEYEQLIILWEQRANELF